MMFYYLGLRWDSPAISGANLQLQYVKHCVKMAFGNGKFQLRYVKKLHLNLCLSM